MKSSPNNTVCFFNLFPPELLETILSSFCDGKALSSLYAAAFHHTILPKLIQKIIDRKLLRLADLIESNGLASEHQTPAGQRDLRDACHWIRSIPSGDENLEAKRLSKVVSENAMILDFLQMSLQEYCDIKKGYFEWPIWCGLICVEFFDTGDRVRHTVAVTITSPMQQPSLIPGASLIRNWCPFGNFRSEPYLMVPLPPWGRVHALPSDGAASLNLIVQSLSRTGQLGVPVHRGGDSLNVRLITRDQAVNRSARVPSSKTSWLLDQQSTDLFCSWYDDSDGISNPRDYIDYIYHLQKVRQRLQSGTVGTRIQMTSPMHETM